MLRAVFLLTLAIGASVLATYYFGQDVLFALGLIVVQLKVLGQKLLNLKPALILAWFKAHGLVFLRKDIPYKWLSSVVLPMVVGKRLFRRISQMVGRITAPILAQHQRLMDWYRARSGIEKVFLTLALVTSTLALMVTSMGLWLILFSVSLPIWIISTFVAFGRLLLVSLEKYLFKMVAFLQLRWLGRALTRLMPQRWVNWKRRVDFRVARAVIRKRRMTVQQLAARKDRLPFRTGVLLEFLFSPRRD